MLASTIHSIVRSSYPAELIHPCNTTPASEVNTTLPMSHHGALPISPKPSASWVLPYGRLEIHTYIQHLYYFAAGNSKVSFECCCRILSDGTNGKFTVVANKTSTIEENCGNSCIPQVKALSMQTMTEMEWQGKVQNMGT